MNTPLPLDAAELDEIGARRDEVVTMQAPLSRPGYVPIDADERNALVAQSRAALTLAARVAELERERDEARERADAYAVAVDESDHRGMAWMATANALRDALEKHPRTAEWNEATGEYDLPHGSAVPCPLCAALAAHPAASLAAHDAEVLERAAKVCDERAAQWRKLEDQYRERGQREFMEVACVHRQAAESLAAAIRALAAQAQERTEEQWECPTCGLGVAADEDGCCATCGADCNRQEVKS